MLALIAEAIKRAQRNALRAIPDAVSTNAGIELADTKGGVRLWVGWIYQAHYYERHTEISFAAVKAGTVTIDDGFNHAINEAFQAMWVIRPPQPKQPTKATKTKRQKCKSKSA
jgi:hypothetical protein